RAASDARAAPPLGAAFSYYVVHSLFLTSSEQRANNSHAAGQGLRTTLRLPTRQFPSRRRCGREAVCVGRSFPGEMCDETDLCCVCGIAGTAGFVSIRDRGAEDSQAMQ